MPNLIDIRQSTVVFVKKRKKALLLLVGTIVGLTLITQLIYPTDQLLPFSYIDGVNVSGAKKELAIQELNERASKSEIAIMLNDQSSAVRTVMPQDIGITIDNATRIDNRQYPFLWRLIPGSIFWYSAVQEDTGVAHSYDATQITRFVREQFGKGCKLPPKNASLTVVDGVIQTTDARDGGTCKESEVLSIIENFKPNIASTNTLRINVVPQSPSISSTDAETIAETVNDATEEGVAMQVGDTVQRIDRKDIFSWIEFSDAGKSISVTLNTKKSSSYFDKTISPSVVVPSTKSYVTTQDFTVLSEKKGKSGVGLDMAATRKSIVDVLLGDQQQAIAKTITTEPEVVYSRNYTSTSVGIAAMLQHYSDEHAGVYGVAFRELGGRGLAAEYQGDKSFITASTYKLFVAYGTLKKFESGDWQWSDRVVDGRDLAQCFTDMIEKSDNPCAEALYKKIGYQKTIDDVAALGLQNTFTDADTQHTSASDLITFLSKLESGQIDLKKESRERLLNAMKRNQYRSGVPSGTSGVVADKVGFLNDLLHDAAIVYSPKGTYSLAIMSDGATWGDLAEITRKIESLR